MAPPKSLTTDRLTHVEVQVESNQSSDSPSEAPSLSVKDANIGASGAIRRNDVGDDRTSGLTRGDRRVVIAFVSIALVLMVVHWLRIVGWQPSPVTVERPVSDEYRFALDVNTATWVEWMQLDGIGETLARRIVANREEHGPYANVEDVDRVPGVGHKTLARVRDYLICGSLKTDR